MTTLKASLVATVIGTGAWLMGLDRTMWPAHPQLALFLTTLGATIVLRKLIAKDLASQPRP